MSPPTSESPGTLTALIEEVVRGTPAPAGDDGWGGALRAGATFGRYELLREVGRGGFGVVWEAKDRELGRTVAFKALRVGGEASRERRLLAEAEVAARLSHPNIVTVLDVGRAEQGVYLVQEFLTGAPLSKRLAEGRLPVREAVRVAVELARGLAHAHAHGVVHRDLTPGNVQLCDDGQVKLLDLGMAAALGRRKLEGGTPAYMAPEQAAGAPEDERTDVYALGVLLYRMLTGQAPVEVDRRGAPRSASRGLEVPECPPLAALVETMLAREPTERPRDAGVVLEALREVEHTLPLAAAPSRVRVRRAPRARWMAAGLLAGLLLAAGIGVTIAATVAGRPAPKLQALVLSAAARSQDCTWRLFERFDFTMKDAGLRWRNGDFQQQSLVMEGTESHWLQASDWNQLFLPAGKKRPEVFAIEARFKLLDEKRTIVTFHIYGDPLGPMDHTSSDLAHGRGLQLDRDPGNATRYEWGITDGVNTRRVLSRGLLPSVSSGQWHTLRFEGSRSGCWLRVQLDDSPILSELGACDLEGSDIMLGANGGPYTQANVLWKQVARFEGEPNCQ